MQMKSFDMLKAVREQRARERMERKQKRNAQLGKPRENAQENVGNPLNTWHVEAKDAAEQAGEVAGTDSVWDAKPVDVVPDSNAEPIGSKASSDDANSSESPIGREETETGDTDLSGDSPSDPDVNLDILLEDLGDIKPQHLVDELANSGEKYAIDQVVAVFKTAEDKLVGLEVGRKSAGLKHIFERRVGDFAEQGIQKI